MSEVHTTAQPGKTNMSDQLAWVRWYLFVQTRTRWHTPSVLGQQQQREGILSECFEYLLSAGRKDRGVFVLSDWGPGLFDLDLGGENAPSDI